ncbi:MULTISPECIES: hypothetical protein [Bacillus cereus group]|uniref:Uncharacterized protein n=1 Tax=Bacillus thuringiensis TaxID=1428 RepID=A0A9X7AS69_BACTU|nr:MULTISPECIES: hypothetical protein [Bacillus cereus group]PFT50885.1 hypothetical protein COK72_02430 [Bacillus thuringiensis]PFY22922.1 hypothetical protein COL44_18750 [Bacillus toyonensis]
MKPYVDKALEILENKLQVIEYSLIRVETVYNAFKDNEEIEKQDFEEIERRYLSLKNSKGDLQNALRILYEQGVTRV